MTPCTAPIETQGDLCPTDKRLFTLWTLHSREPPPALWTLHSRELSPVQRYIDMLNVYAIQLHNQRYDLIIHTAVQRQQFNYFKCESEIEISQMEQIGRRSLLCNTKMRITSDYIS